MAINSSPAWRSWHRDGETLQRRNVKAKSSSVFWRRLSNKKLKEKRQAETCVPLLFPLRQSFLRETSPSLNAYFLVGNVAD